MRRLALPVLALLAGLGASAPLGAQARAGSEALSVGDILATARRYVGTPYTFGGTTAAGGFDCSGFVRFVFGRHGIRLPRTSRQQAAIGRRLPSRTRALRPGDLLFFATHGRRIDHVAIYLGAGKIVHASAYGRRVRVDSLADRHGTWLLRHRVATRRVVGVPALVDPALADASLAPEILETLRADSTLRTPPLALSTTLPADSAGEWDAP